MSVEAMPAEPVAVVGSEVVAESHAAVRTRRTVRELRHATRRRQAVELRLSGLTFSQIGDALGISQQAASKLYAAAIRATYRAPAEEARELELARCDAITARWWPSLNDPDDRVADVATKNLVRVMQHRASLLGLERPTIEATVPPGAIVVPSSETVWQMLQEYRREALAAEQAIEAESRSNRGGE